MPAHKCTRAHHSAVITCTYIHHTCSSKYEIACSSYKFIFLCVSSSSAGLLRMRSGIQKMSEVQVADNSPAATPYRIAPKCIHVYGKKNANVGDKVLLAVRGEMKKALVVGTKVPVHGTHPRVRFDDNFVVLLNNKDEPVGTRIKVPLPSTLRHLSHRYNKVLALAKKFV